MGLIIKPNDFDHVMQNKCSKILTGFQTDTQTNNSKDMDRDLERETWLLNYMVKHQFQFPNFFFKYNRGGDA